jgi:hypothetical protein
MLSFRAFEGEQYGSEKIGLISVQSIVVVVVVAQMAR